MRRERGRHAGFTLIELLVVIAIVAILAALTIPSLSSTLRATNLKAAGRTLIDQFNYARQLALARNLQAEVRLYKLPDYPEATTATPSVYRALQIFLIDENGNPVPFSRPEYFRNPVVISPDVLESAILADAATNGSPHVERAPTSADPRVGNFGSNYRYVPFQFSPSGSTDLSPGKNFVTLIVQNATPVTQGGSFFTVQVDCVNGSVRSVRP